MYIPHGTHFEEYCFLSSENKLMHNTMPLCIADIDLVVDFSKYQNFEEKLLIFFPNIKILKKNWYYLFFSTFYESNNGVIGILASENIKNDSSIMFIPYLVAKIC